MAALGPLQAVCLVALGLTLALAWWLRRRSRAMRSTLGLPKGTIVASDMEGWERGETLRAPRYGLVGRPDYLVKQGRRLVPVEVKPQRRAAAPFEADMLQLAAYCLLVEEHTGQRPRHGLLCYRERAFRIPYTRRLRARLLATLEQMRHDAAHNTARRSHADPHRCRQCGLRAFCDESL